MENNGKQRGHILNINYSATDVQTDRHRLFTDFRSRHFWVKNVFSRRRQQTTADFLLEKSKKRGTWQIVNLRPEYDKYFMNIARRASKKGEKRKDIEVRSMLLSSYLSYGKCSGSPYAIRMHLLTFF